MVDNNHKQKLIIIIIILFIVLIFILWFILKKTKKINNLLPIVPQVDLNRYQGLWYEIARLPTYFEKGCIGATASYQLNNDKTINVLNKCTISGEEISVTGIAFPDFNEIIPGSNIYPGSFTVRFAPNPISKSKVSGEYKIIYLDPNYQYAMVGTSNRNNLWILSRKNSINNTTFNMLIDFAKKYGFDINKLIINQ